MSRGGHKHGGNMSLGSTPSQTVGPFVAVGLPWADGPFVVPPDTPGSVVIEGRVLDGAGQPVPDALVETWQADPDGWLARVREVADRSGRKLPHRHCPPGPLALSWWRDRGAPPGRFRLRSGFA